MMKTKSRTRDSKSRSVSDRNSNLDTVNTSRLLYSMFSVVAAAAGVFADVDAVAIKFNDMINSSLHSKDC